MKIKVKEYMEAIHKAEEEGFRKGQEAAWAAQREIERQKGVTDRLDRLEKNVRRLDIRTSSDELPFMEEPCGADADN